MGCPSWCCFFVQQIFLTWDDKEWSCVLPYFKCMQLQIWIEWLCVFTVGVLISPYPNQEGNVSPGTCNPEETSLPGLPLSWSPTLFSGSGPVTLPPVPRTEKTIEREIGRAKDLPAPRYESCCPNTYELYNIVSFATPVGFHPEPHFRLVWTCYRAVCVHKDTLYLTMWVEEHYFVTKCRNYRSTGLLCGTSWRNQMFEMHCVTKKFLVGT
jgi:hypothetical protein